MRGGHLDDSKGVGRRRWILRQVVWDVILAKAASANPLEDRRVHERGAGHLHVHKRVRGIRDAVEWWSGDEGRADVRAW